MYVLVMPKRQSHVALSCSHLFADHDCATFVSMCVMVILTHPHRHCKILCDLHHKGFEPGEEVNETDMASWADWEAQFFDLESALVTRAAAPGEAKAKARKKII